jgi:hypothetical protein
MQSTTIPFCLCLVVAGCSGAPSDHGDNNPGDEGKLGEVTQPICNGTLAGNTGAVDIDLGPFSICCTGVAILGVQSGCYGDGNWDGRCCASGWTVTAAKYSTNKKDQIKTWRATEGLDACFEYTPGSWVCP